MHIPDSVLSPAVSIAVGAVMVPIWAVAAKQVKAKLGSKQTPMLALGAAFCFVIMMFNIPALGGTTAHPVAGTLLAILLGPWAACIGISVALAIQALFFGDGGILAYGVNCFVMAFVLPFVGYAIYRALMSRFPEREGWRAFASATGAYFGINAAAAVVATFLGVQPSLFHEANGQPLYFPFGLNITLPAMMGTHLLVAGPAEAIVTALVVRFVMKSGIPLYDSMKRADGDTLELALPNRKPRYEGLLVGLLALVALVPLGLLAKGDAWGEWDANGVKEETAKVFGEKRGFVPKGIEAGEARSYKGVRGLEDYASSDGKNKWGYLGAGVLGVGTISGLLLVGGRALTKKEDTPEIAAELYASKNVVRRFAPPLPEWLKQSGSSLESPPATKSKPANQFVEKSLEELSAKAFKLLNSEPLRNAKGLLQQIDPRAKAIAALAAIIGVAFIRSLPVLALITAVSLGLAVASRIPLAPLLKRVWLSVPLFVGTLVLPALLNVVNPGKEIFVFWHSPHLSVTVPGALIAFTLVFRVGTAVTIATLLTMTTRWNDLLYALQSLALPRLFLSVLAMTYRYLSVMLQSANEIFVARKSRTVGRVSNSEGRQFVGTSVGTLFTKTMTLAEEVHSAMVSRGYTGAVHTMTRLSWTPKDSLFLTLSFVSVALCVFVSLRV